MSSTNHTANYNLPQFVGTDKPAWLGDINPAMSAIDTQMKANADGVAGVLDMFNLDHYSSKDASSLISITGLTVGGVLRVAQNADGSIFKFYNYMVVTNATDNTISIPLSAVPGLSGYYGLKTIQLNQAPAEAYTINAGGTTIIRSNDGATLTNVNLANLYVGTDGYVYIMTSTTSTATIAGHGQLQHIFHPCVYFNANFGD